MAVEESFGNVVSSLAESGEDAEVDTLLRDEAIAGVLCQDGLKQHWENLGGSSSEEATGIALPLTLRPAFRANIPEERVAESLLTAFAAVNGSRAVYRTLALLASEAGEPETARMATDIETKRNRAAGEIWSLIPTRVKIAFNILTAGETDPAVSTRTSQNSLL